MRPRITIARLVVVIAFCGVAFASLRSPSELWAATLFALALGSLPVALLNVVYSRGGRRAFWAGFLVCGATYFTATLGPWFRDEVGPRLVTTAALDLLYAHIAPQAAFTTVVTSWSGAQSPNLILLSSANTNGTITLTPSLDPANGWAAWTRTDRADGVGVPVGNVTLVSTAPFRRIGHSLLTLAVAVLGGLYARRRFEVNGAVAPG